MATRAFANTVRSRSMTSSARLSTAGWHDSLAGVQPCVPLAGSYRIAPALLNYSRLSFATEAETERLNNTPELAENSKQKLYLELEEKDYKDILAVLQKSGQGGAYEILNAARLAADDVVVHKVPRPLPMKKVLELREKAGEFRARLPASVMNEMLRDLRRLRGRETDSEDEE